MDEVELRSRVLALVQEHRDLDVAIDALRGLIGHDQIQLARLKKRKLRLRDELAVLHDMLVPDIIA
ncbi:MAG: YdcH family protein [Janthinobacterium lividum]